MPKLVTVRHGRLTVSVPEGWEDDTTVSFGGPIHNRVGKDPVELGGSWRSTLAVSIENVPAGIHSPEEFLKALGEGLSAAGARLRDVSVGPFEMGGKKGALAEREVELPNGRIRQLTAVALSGSNAVLATAATDATVIEQERATLLSVLAAVKVE